MFPHRDLPRLLRKTKPKAILRPLQKRLSPAVMRIHLCFAGWNGLPCVEISPLCNITFFSSCLAFDGGNNFPKAPPFWKWSNKRWVNCIQKGIAGEMKFSLPVLHHFPIAPVFLLPWLHFLVNTFLVDQKWTPNIEEVASSSLLHCSHLVILISFSTHSRKHIWGLKKFFKLDSLCFRK